MSTGDFSTGVGVQITNLVNSLDRKNYRENVSEIEKLIQTFGHEAYRFLLRHLLKSINFHNPVQKDQFKFKLLKQEFAKLTTQTNFVSLIIEVFEDNENSTQAQFLSQLSQSLSLPLSQQVLMGLGLAQSKDPTTQQEGKNFLKIKLPEILESNTNVLPDTIIHHFVHFVSNSPDFAKEREKVLKQFSAHANNPSMAQYFSENASNSKRNTSSSDISAKDIDDMSQLSEVMSQLGYSCCANAELFSKVLSQFSNITEQDQAKAIGLIATTHSGLQSNINFQTSFYMSIGEQVPPNASAWNIDAFVAVVKKRFAKFNWKNVVRQFDYPGFKLQDQRGLAIIAQIYRKITDEPLPVESIVKDSWNNTDAQLSFITLGLDAPPDTLNFSSPALRQVNLGNVATLSRQSQPSWTCLDLIETLLNLAEGENYKKCRKLFDYPIKHSLEQLVVGLAEAKPKRIGLQTELLNTLLPTFIRTHKHSIPVLSQILTVNPLLLINSLSETYYKDNNTIQRILEIAQQLKALDQVLSAKPYRFAIELAVVAARRDHLNLEHWLSKNIEQNRNPFVVECISFLSEKLQRSEKRDLVSDWTGIFFKVLQAKRNLIPVELSEQIYKLYQSTDSKLQSEVPNEFTTTEEIEIMANKFFTDIFSEIKGVELAINELRNFKASKQPNDQALFTCIIHNLFDEYRFFEQYPPEVLAKVGLLFGTLIQQNIIVAKTLRYALIYVLQALNNPQKPKMLQFGLIALNQFKARLPEWPEFCSHLRNIPQVAQMLPEVVYYINRGLSSGEQSADSGVTSPVPPVNANPSAIQGFNIANLPNIQQNVQTIQQNLQNLQTIQANLQSLPTQPVATSITPPTIQQPVTLPTAQQPTMSIPTTTPQPPRGVSPPLIGATVEQATPPQATVTKRPNVSSIGEDKETGASTSIGFQLDISTLTHNTNNQNIVPPDSEVVDKIHFIINNISMTNLPDKANDLKKLLKDDHYAYFANYLVVHRSSLEPNFHKLYAKFLSALNVKTLDTTVLEQTYLNINALLNSERIKNSISERSLLKNLGSWLGHLTIEKNKPILQKDLDLKALLFDAYENGKLIAVIPFVCKILTHCQNSKVFKPPNPWVMGLISLLAEIHGLPDLKLNLKFEVEVLSKNLSLVLSQVETKGLLEGRSLHVEQNPDVTNPAPSPGKPLQQEVLPKPDVKVFLFNDNLIPEMQLLLRDLPEQVKINPELTVFQDQPNLKKLVYMGIDRAIRDIVGPVVRRSVTIATRTTSHLITKDFAMETDASKMRRASQLMVQNLSAKLAMVTCKDLLKSSIRNYLISALQTIAVDQNEASLASLATEIERIAEIISSENLDLGCSYVENAATERGVININEALTTEFDARKNYQQSGGQLPWTSYNINNYARALPPRLAPKNGLLKHHLQVYEDFKRQASTASEEVSQLMSVQQVVDKVNEIIAEITKLAKKAKKASTILTMANDMSDIIHQAVSVPAVIEQAQSIEDAVSAVVKSVFSKFFETDNVLVREVLFLILDSAKSISNVVAKSLTEMWSNLADEKKLSKELAPAFLRSELLSITEFDNQLGAKLAVESKNSKVFNRLALYILKKCMVSEKSIAFADVPKIVAHLTKNSKKLSDNQNNVAELLEQAKLVSSINKTVFENRMSLLIQASSDFENQDKEAFRDKITSKFDQWLQLLNTPRAVFGERQDKKKKPLEEQKQSVLSELMKLKVLQSDAEWQSFIQITFQLAVIDFNQAIITTNKPAGLFRYIDAMTDLCSNLILKKAEKNRRANLVKSLLQIITKFIVRDHEISSDKFNQRIYLRFFSNMLIELSDVMGAISNTEPLAATTTTSESSQDEGETASDYLDLLFQFADAFLHLDPSKVPGFSFAWLELISHRMFMPKLFFSKNRDGWAKFHDLLIALFTFLEPHTRNAELNGPIRLIYRGTLKILLILLHDFPEILCNYHFSLCDVIPPTCIQMRNLILSAFPRNMRLPDPFTPNLKVDLLPEIKITPKILSNYTRALDESKTLTREMVDQFLTKSRPQPNFLPNLKNNLMLNPASKDPSQPRYNVPLLNALVLYVGVQAITHPQADAAVVNTTAMSLFEHLILNLDEEGRYLFLNALANQLRYPNNHTHYFSCVLLYLFSEVPKIDQLSDDFGEEIQEQITRVLLERLIVYRPHPWGMLITFIELVKNQRYKFWEKPFIRCAPEIERLFENVGKSII